MSASGYLFDRTGMQKKLKQNKYYYYYYYYRVFIKQIITF